MARISGVNLPLNKRSVIGLTYIHGIGESTARKILAKTGVDENTRIGDLTEEEVVKLREAVEDNTVEGDLRRERSQNIKRLLPRPAPPSRPAGPGTAHEDQRPWPQGPPPHEHRGQEEGPDGQVDLRIRGTHSDAAT
jgi:ribosomal protein uS13